jgi:hypothetical protein
VILDNTVRRISKSSSYSLLKKSGVNDFLYTELSTKVKLECKTKMCGINVLFPMYLCKIPQGCKWEEVTRI